MIRYFTAKRQKGCWLYACADDNMGHDLNKQWDQWTREEVTSLLSTGWKFYYKHDQFLYEIDPNKQKDSRLMKIVEAKQKTTVLDQIQTGECFRYGGPVYLATNKQTTDTRTVVDIATGHAHVLSCQVAVQRVSVEAHVSEVQ